jgi:hypothetical protein
VENSNRATLQITGEKQFATLTGHLDSITALDDLRLHLDERKKLGLEIAFRLKHNQQGLEEQFNLIEKLFWQNSDVLREFHTEINAYRRRFLIFQDGKYPWWYPEKRRSKAKPLLSE